MILGYTKYSFIYRMRFVCMFEVEKFSKDELFRFATTVTNYLPWAWM